MTDFTVKNAIDTLNRNAASMQKLAGEIYELRILHNAAKMELAKKEYETREKYFNKTTELPIRISEFRDFIKWETYKELAKEQELAAQIKLKVEALHTLEQLANINKFVEKLQYLNISF